MLLLNAVQIVSGECTAAPVQFTSTVSITDAGVDTDFLVVSMLNRQTMQPQFKYLQDSSREIGSTRGRLTDKR